MARGVITVATTGRSGLIPTYIAADSANGHLFLNPNENVLLHVKNANAGAVVVTIPTPGTIDGLSVTDRTVSVAAGTEVFIGPFNNTHYGNSDGVYIDFDIDASITFTAFNLGAKF